METTIVNPRRRLPPRGAGGQFKKRAATKRYRRRSNPAPVDNPRRRRRRSYRRRNAIALAPAANPRRYRRRRMNPEGISLGRIVAAGLGATGVRLAARKIGGLRAADGKLTGTHYLTMAAGIYVAPAVAEWLGADGAEQRAAQDGAAGVALSMLVDEHADDFSSKHLFPFRSPNPTGATEGILGYPGLSADNPLEAGEYERLAGLGALDAAGSYVRAPDGSVWYMPTPMQGVDGMDADETRVEIPADAKVGQIIRDSASGRRFKLGQDRDGSFLLFPLPAGSVSGIGASTAADRYRDSVQ